jgi:hypothetical protein
MNIERNILRTSELDRTTKLFLHTLASYCDETCECYPGQDELAQVMSTSIRTVQRCLRLCVELGLVRVRRRWKRSNVYRVLCLVKRKLSTMTTSTAQENKPPKNYTNVPPHQRHKVKIKPRELLVCYQDIEEVIGAEVLKRNKNWLRHMIIRAGYDKFQDALHWLRTAMREGQVEDRPIKKPSAILTWYLRTHLCVEV